jgi:hypothetical protein
MFVPYLTKEPDVPFFEDSDVKLAPTPAPKARRNRLLPALLISVNLGVLVLLVVLALPGLNLNVLGASNSNGRAKLSAADLPPEMVTTPSGRVLNLQEFGGYLFEVTRLLYAGNPAQRTITLTVPGNPPQQGMFRIGESIAGGALRIVDIQPHSVILSFNGEQQTFPVEGADLSQVWGSAEGDKHPTTGTTMMPARNQQVVSDLLPGQVRAPRDPMAEPTRADSPKREQSGVNPLLQDRELEGEGALEDMPEERVIGLGRTEYNNLVRTLPDLMERDFVFGSVFEPETRYPWGLEVKNIHNESIFMRYGMRPGDILVGINDYDIVRIRDLDQAARSSNSYREFLELYVWRGEEPIIFRYHPGGGDRN